jgi:hypothetical protein
MERNEKKSRSFGDLAINLLSWRIEIKEAGSSGDLRYSCCKRPKSNKPDV